MVKIQPQIVTTGLMLLLFFKLSSQTINTFAGTGVLGYSGDGGFATNAKFDFPTGAAVDAAGNVYISDYYNNTIRKINTSGIISSFAGSGVPGFGGDGGAAINASLKTPNAVAVDASGNVFICDYGNNVIRKVNTLGIISTVAGTAGQGGFSGDGGMATNALLKYPFGIAVDPLGNLFIADLGNYRLRKVNTAGIISTFAGTGFAGYTGDGGPATNATINGPYGVTIDAQGNIFLTDFGNGCIRKINTSGIISTFAGTGNPGFSGDGGQAALAQLNSPYGMVIDASGNMYVSEYGANDRIRKINTASIISTFAGTGNQGFSGDGGPALNAKLDNPTGLAIDGAGNLIIADQSNYRVRIISLVTGEEQLSINNRINLFPNPNNGSFNLQIENEINNSEFILINSLGQKVLDQAISQKETNIVTPHLAKGFYYYSVFQNKKQIYNGKLSVE